MVKFFWILAIISSIFGGILTIIGLSGDNSAVQEAAGGAIGAAFAIIPYVIARAISELSAKKE